MHVFMSMCGQVELSYCHGEDIFAGLTLKRAVRGLRLDSVVLGFEFELVFKFRLEVGCWAFSSFYFI